MANTDLVVQLGARLDNFEQGMDKAVGLAESAINSIQSKFDNLNPTVGAGFISAGIVGAIGGMSALLGFAGKVNSELADMDKTARQVGLTVEKFQALRFAANVGGVDNSGFAEGLQKSTGLLADAQRNTNSLLQLFDANGLKIADNNGKLISTNQLLANSATLLSRAASEQDKIKIAQMLGFTREWVPVLEKGADALAVTAAEAERLGLIIQQSTIDKAAKFDEEWTKASVSLSYQIKSATADAAVWLSELIDQATKYVDALSAARGAGPDSGQQSFNAIADAIDLVRKDAMGLAQDYDQVTRALERYKASATADAGVIAGLEEVQQKAKEAADELTRAAAARNALLGASSESQFPGGVPLPISRPKPSGASTVIPSKETDSANAFDRATESIVKHTAKTEADTRAVGLGEAALQEFRAESQLLAAAQQAGLPITQAMRDKIQDLAQDAGEAANALARARIATGTAFQRDTAFLTQEDLQIAQQLRSIYGNDVPTALASTEAAAMRSANAMRQIGEIGQETNRSLFVEFGQSIRSGASAWESFSKAGTNALGRISDKLMSMAADNLWRAAFGGSSGGLLSGLFGGSSSELPGFGTSSFVGPQLADGGVIPPGGLALVSEHSPGGGRFVRAGSEPVMVTPNDVAARKGGGSVTVAPSYNIDATGADPAAISRLERTITALNASLERRAVSAVAQHQYRNG